MTLANKMNRLKELEANTAFQQLPAEQKMVLVAGEKLLAMFTKLTNFLQQLQAQNQANPLAWETSKDYAPISEQEQQNNPLFLIKAFSKEIKAELAQNNARLASLEDSLQTQQTNLEQLVEQTNHPEQNNFLNIKFANYQDFENYLISQAAKITEREIQNYLHEKDLFYETQSNQSYQKLVQEHELAKAEILKIYQSQISNGKKLDDLELLVQEQSQQIKLLTEQRNDILISIGKLLKKNALDWKQLQAVFNLQSTSEISAALRDLIKSSFAEDFLTRPQIEQLVHTVVLQQFENKISALVANQNNPTQPTPNDANNPQIVGTFVTPITTDNAFATLPATSSANAQTTGIEQDLVQIYDALASQTAHLERFCNLLGTKFDHYEQAAQTLYTKLSNFTNNGGKNLPLTSNHHPAITPDWDFFTDSDSDMKKHNYYDEKTPLHGTKITRITQRKTPQKLSQWTNQPPTAPTTLAWESDVNTLISEQHQNLQQYEQQPPAVPTSTPSEQQTVWQAEIIALQNRIANQDKVIMELQKAAQKQAEPPVPATPPAPLLPADTLVDLALNKMQAQQKAQENAVFHQLNQLQTQLTNTLQNSLDQYQTSTLHALQNQAHKIKTVEEKLSNFVMRQTQELQELQKQEVQLEMARIEQERQMVQEALEAEKTRLLQEIHLAQKKMDKLQNQPEVYDEVIITAQKQPPVPIQPATPPKPRPPFFAKPKPVAPSTVSDPTIALEPPKQKRKQQVFFEIRKHNRPKLTRADLTR